MKVPRGCRSGDAMDLKGKLSYGGGTAAVFGVIELNATEENGTTSGLQIKD